MTNCFFFAWRLFARRGGYCVIRRCKTFPGFHWLWCPPDRNPRNWLSYGPLKHKGSAKALIHKLAYRGRVYRGDDWVDSCDPALWRDSLTTSLFFLVVATTTYALGMTGALLYRLWRSHA